MTLPTLPDEYLKSVIVSFYAEDGTLKSIFDLPAVFFSFKTEQRIKELPVYVVGMEESHYSYFHLQKSRNLQLVIQILPGGFKIGESSYTGTIELLLEPHGPLLHSIDRGYILIQSGNESLTPTNLDNLYPK